MRQSFSKERGPYGDEGVWLVKMKDIMLQAKGSA